MSLFSLSQSSLSHGQLLFFMQPRVGRRNREEAESKRNQEYRKMLTGLALCKLALCSWLGGYLKLSLVKLAAQVSYNLWPLVASCLPFPQPDECPLFLQVPNLSSGHLQLLCWSLFNPLKMILLDQINKGLQNSFFSLIVLNQSPRNTHMVFLPKQILAIELELRQHQYVLTLVF